MHKRAGGLPAAFALRWLAGCLTKVVLIKRGSGRGVEGRGQEPEEEKEKRSEEKIRFLGHLASQGCASASPSSQGRAVGLPASGTDSRSPSAALWLTAFPIHLLRQPVRVVIQLWCLELADT